MKQAIIFGAGNIGRGFMGQLFSESGYEVTFVDVDRPLLDTLNERGRYTIRLVTNEQTEEVTVGPVRALHSGDLDAVAEAVSRAEIGATAVGAGILKHIAPAVAAGIARRAQLGVSAPFNLILCENLHGAAAIFREMVLAALPAEHHAYLAAHIGFVDTVIARMVPPLTPELRAQDPSLIIVEPYKELPVDRDGFVGEPPPIVGMIPYAPFAFFTDRKLYIHNAGHAVLGYLGYLAGYEYGYQSLADDEIYLQARGAMEESALALTRQVPAGAGRADGQHRRPAAPLRQPRARRHDPPPGPRPGAQAGAFRPAGGRRAERAGAGRDARASRDRHCGRPPLRASRRSRGATGSGAIAGTGDRARADRGVRPGGGRAAGREW